jgi:hypothetical protein
MDGDRKHNEAKEVLYRICWVTRDGRNSGKGPAVFSESEARQRANGFRLKYPHLKYWVEAEA